MPIHRHVRLTCLLLVSGGLAGCGYVRVPAGSGLTGDTNKRPNPVPFIVSVSPSRAYSNALYRGTVSGANFVPGSTVFFGSIPAATTYMSETSLAFQAPVGVEPLSIEVQNPIPGGGVSSPLTLTVADPVVLSSTPSSTISLDPGTVVQLAALNNGVAEPVTWTLATNAADQGTITASGLYTAPAVLDLDSSVQAVGTSTIHLGAAVVVLITFHQPAPILSAFNPASAAAYTPYRGAVAGSNFTPTSLVLVNGSPVPTSYIDTHTMSFRTQLQNTSLSITVATPSGQASAPVTLPITQGGVTYDAAVRFLKQATWGPTAGSVALVQQEGFSAYLDQQLALPVDSMVVDANFAHFYEDLWANAMLKPSVLRQKTMWIWYRLFNTNSIGESTNIAFDASGPEQIMRDAFAHYDRLLLDTSLNTSMGFQYNHCCIDDAGPNPNQNYAREILQLFTTGPFLLTQDGSRQTQSNGPPLLAYTQTDVEEVARAFTGWNLAKGWAEGTDVEGLETMMEKGTYAHDAGTKMVLGAVVPSGGDALTDMKTVVQILTNAPNTAPFLSERLIRGFVTSNPSPAYISRVAGVWLDDGSGVRGNVAAVIRAILLDPEAREGDDPEATLAPAEGRVMDVIEFQIAANLALETNPLGIAYLSEKSACQMNECLFQSPSVFGYYMQGYSLPGTSTLAPELSLFTSTALQQKSTYLQNLIYPAPDSNVSPIFSGWDQYTTGDGSALVDQINISCLSGRMSTGLRDVLLKSYTAVPVDASHSQVRRLLYLTLMSPEFAVIR